MGNTKLNGLKCMAFYWCGISNVERDYLSNESSSYICYTNVAFHCCGFWSVERDNLSNENFSWICRTCMAFPCCASIFGVQRDLHLWEKLLSQMSHLYGFLLVWSLKCRTRLPFKRRFFVQISHLCGFLLLWILKCWTRTPFHQKFFVHMSHSHGFSPVWILKRRMKLCLKWKFFVDMSYVYGFSLLFVGSCCSMILPFREKLLSQMPRFYGFLTVCNIKSRTRQPFQRKLFMPVS